MALPDILSAIDQKTDKELAQIEKDFKEKEAALKTEYEKKLHDRKEQILKNLKAKADRKVSQANFQVQSQVNSKVLIKKREIIEEVFKKALENLKSLDNADALKLLVKLFKALPEVEEGEIIPEKNSSTVIKEAVTKSGIKYEVSSESISGNGGFIFKSAGI